MRTRLLSLIWGVLSVLPLQAQTEERYIEVTGTSEIEIVPDKIHYIIEIREYFEEEFDGKSKPEDYRTKVSLNDIEWKLREALDEAGVSQDAIRTQEIGDYWRERGHDFLVSKRFDITLTDFKLIDEIIGNIDTRGINTMRVENWKTRTCLYIIGKGRLKHLWPPGEKLNIWWRRLVRNWVM